MGIECETFQAEETYRGRNGQAVPFNPWKVPRGADDCSREQVRCANGAGRRDY